MPFYFECDAICVYYITVILKNFCITCPVRKLYSHLISKCAVEPSTKRKNRQYKTKLKFRKQNKVTVPKICHYIDCASIENER